MLRFVATSILNYGFGVALVWLLPRIAVILADRRRRPERALEVAA
jgi:hypothetical protein